MEYRQYIILMNRQINNNDVRERVFQDNVIRPFLQDIFEELDIEPVDIKVNASMHDYLQYCGTYSRKRGETTIEVPGTPDLCITQNWNWYNKKYEVMYKAVVEIKSPALDPITGYEPEKYKCLDEVNRHLRATKNDRVILTDGVTWAFYKKEEMLRPICEPICLGELEYKRKNNGRKNPGLERTSSGKPILKEIHWKENSEQFDKLVETLKRFISF